MESSQIARLLQPFAGAGISPDLLKQLGVYLELLTRWNARINLTAVRDPEQIVTRHFGESLFVAQVLMSSIGRDSFSIADVGSGAGFPGVPIKLLAQNIQLTLLESQNKKATFLRELVRALTIPDTEVFCGRAEDWGKTADVVTLRAVERFERVLPVAASLVAPGGHLCALIGKAQVSSAITALGEAWSDANVHAIPESSDRVVAIWAKR